MASFSEAPRPRRQTASRSTLRQVVTIAALAAIAIGILVAFGAVR